MLSNIIYLLFVILQRWIQERMPAATSTDYGNSLQSVRTLQKKNNALQTEIDGHQPRIDEVCERGQAMIEENHPRSPEIDEGLRNMNDQLEKLKDAVKDRDDRLKESEKAQKVSSFTISSKKCNIFLVVLDALSTYFHMT